MNHLVVTQTCKDGDKGHTDKIHFTRIVTGHARSPQDAQAGRQQRQQKQRNARIDQQAKHQVAHDRNHGNQLNVLLDELPVLLGVDISAGWSHPQPRVAKLSVRAESRNPLPHPAHHSHRELVIHGALPGLGYDQQRPVVLAEEPVPASPVEIETGELGKALAASRQRIHEAQGIRQEVTRAQRRKGRDHLRAGLPEGQPDALRSQAPAHFVALVRLDERGEVPDVEPHHLQQLLVPQSATCVLEKAAGGHVGDQAVGELLHGAGAVLAAPRFHQDE